MTAPMYTPARDVPSFQENVQAFFMFLFVIACFAAAGFAFGALLGALIGTFTELSWLQAASVAAATVAVVVTLAMFSLGRQKKIHLK